MCLFSWTACRSSSDLEVKEAGSVTDAEKAFNKFQDLNSTRARLNGELTGVRNQLFALPKDAPSTMELTRKYAILNFRVTKLELDVTSAQYEWQVELEKAEEAKRQAEEAKRQAEEQAEANKVVAEQGALRLYSYSIKSNPDTGTRSVVGRVENSATVAATDVTVEFELFGPDDKSVGTVTDYTSSIEPGTRWAFKALLLEEAAKRVEYKSLKVKSDLPPLPGKKPE